MFCGGIFVNDYCGREIKYIGGNKVEIEVDVDNFTLGGFEKAIRDILGYRNLEKMHFRVPGSTLADGLRLLYNLSQADMVKIVKENNFVEVFTEHKILRHINGNSNIGRNICDLITATIVDEIASRAVDNLSYNEEGIGAVRSVATEKGSLEIYNGRSVVENI